MDYCELFNRLNEGRLIRGIENLRKGGGQPVVVKLYKPVLYEEDAYKVLQYYVNLSSQTPLPEGPYDRKSNILRLAHNSNGDDCYYWLYIQDGLYYAIEIGMKSKIFIWCTVYIPYEEVRSAYLKVPIRDCTRDLCAPSRLYGYFVYSAAGLKPISVMFESEHLNPDIAAIWGAKVEYREKSSSLKGFDEYGLKGSWYDVWFSPAHSRPIYNKEKTERIPISGHERWWKGEKIIHQFNESERPSLQEMLTIWNIFRKTV